MRIDNGQKFEDLRFTVLPFSVHCEFLIASQTTVWFSCNCPDSFKMPNSQVPPEVLEDIFSQLSSSKSALYHLSLSCKIFYHICKPFLYPHITITTGEQRRRLKEVRKEDAQLVRKLVIRGQERSDGRLRMNGLDNTIGSGIIDDLFQGNLLDISGSFFPSWLPRVVLIRPH